MDIQIGTHVVTADGARVGVVKSVVLSCANQALDGIIVRQGRVFPVDRIVKRHYLSHVDTRGTVHLNVTEARFLTLPRFAYTKRVTPSPQSLREEPYPVAGAMSASTMISGPVQMRTVAPGSGDWASRPAFGPAVTFPGSVHMAHTLEDGLTPITRGTDVVGSDRRKVGTVKELLHDGNGRLTMLVGRGIFPTFHAWSIDADLVASVTPRQIRLHIPAADVVRPRSINDEGLGQRRPSQGTTAWLGSEPAGKAR